MDKIYFLSIFLICVFIPEFAVGQRADSAISHDTALKFLPDTSYSGGRGGMVLPNQPPLDELGPLERQPEQKSSKLIYIICSIIALGAGAAIYFYKGKFKKFDK